VVCNLRTADCNSVAHFVDIKREELQLVSPGSLRDLPRSVRGVGELRLRASLWQKRMARLGRDKLGISV
jgi:hypothetical protein